MLLMIFYRRIPSIRNTFPNSMNLGFAIDSLADKVIQQQRELLNNIGMSSLTSPFNHNETHEADSMVKEEIDRKIRALSRNSEEFFKTG
jgi:hypothetical protein